MPKEGEVSVGISAVERGPYEKRYSVLAAVMLGGIMGPIDGSIVNVVLPTVSTSFGVPVAVIQWVPMIYLLTISSLLLLFGRLGDIVGYRRVYLAGLAGFVVASALCGLAPAAGWLIAFRAIQGLAAAMMMAVPFALITAVFPPQERGKALGINAISISAGLAIGPSLGGLITSTLGWRFVFLVNIPIGVAGLLLAARVLPSTKNDAARIDWQGAVTCFLALFGFLLFVNRAQSGHVPSLLWGVLAAAGIAASLFLLTEKRTVSPLVDLTLFHNRVFSLGLGAALLSFMSQYVLVFLTPFYLQRVLLLPANKVGLVMTASPLAVMIVAPLSGSLSDRIGTRTLAFLGAAISALALALMAGLPGGAEPHDVAWRLALFGCGTGLFQSPNNSAVMGHAPRNRLGTASGVLATMRNVGMVFGIAIAGVVLYATTPAPVLGKGQLSAEEATIFLAALGRAFWVGCLLSVAASLASLARSEHGRQLNP
ncbi:MAG: MFS transporter [candidate division KSB1 bacterium]|nr:MFS transporter [candidate division KSB1 bacterium]MDZ7386372.1 MFS transporter [candidate division KSB1 bacterium]MDZ7394083.1 MFS transporter [candidate division KSB1 bacterium]MDZ7411915.1 MFS transporter [candidate division KSB1 bacterium]